MPVDTTLREYALALTDRPVKVLSSDPAEQIAYILCEAVQKRTLDDLIQRLNEIAGIQWQATA